MALESSDIDAKLDELAGLVRRHRRDAESVKTLTATAVSNLAQVPTTYDELIEAVGLLQGSSNPVDQLQVAKMAKLTQEATDLYAKINAVKNGIDQLGL